MKKILLSSILLTLLCGAAFSQSFSLADTAIYINFQVPVSPNPEGHTTLTNLSGSNLDMAWERTDNNVPSPWLDWICVFPTCWGPFDDYKEFPLGTPDPADVFLTVSPGTTPGSGEVHVDFWDRNNPGYKETVIFYINATVGIEEEMDRAISLYPNPVTDQLRLEWTHEGFRNAGVVITDLAGKVLVEDVLGAGNGTVSLETGSLAPGLYLLNITDREGRLFVRKFVRE